MGSGSRRYNVEREYRRYSGELEQKVQWGAEAEGTVGSGSRRYSEKREQKVHWGGVEGTVGSRSTL